MTTFATTSMSKVSLRRLLSKLTVLALSTGAAAPVAAAASDPSPTRETRDCIDDDADLDAALPIDRECVDPRDAASALGRGLALALARMRPLSATHVASTWALADDQVRRLAVAHALEWTFPLVGHGIMLDHLSRDPDPAVRVAVARAAWVRRSAGGDHGVLTRLAADPDPDVRAVVARSGVL